MPSGLRSGPAAPAVVPPGFFGLILISIVLAAFNTRGDGLSFNRDVRPILSQHCFSCHGPDEKTRKHGLRLDLEEDARRALKSGHRAVVPGKPEDSALVARIELPDGDEKMPPAETKRPLSAEKIAVLKRWIIEGAKYEGHWAYLPPKRPAPPEVRKTDWPRNDIDRFVLARLEKEGVAPSPEASREKLLRRVSLDLTGLPPTVEELEGFLADSDAKAYEKVVDRLLASPHYGERMAQQWLDLARYGETQGYHHDRHRDQWHWRDWVIDAFNRNQPFDQFTIDQLAGDLVPNPTRDQLVATGFHRNEMTTSEGGALPEEYIVKYAVGRVDTTARVWLGTSMACAECHEHKYDPISQKEFYRFFAFFFDTPENGLDAEELNPSPRITLETPEQRAKLDQLDREVAALEASEKMVFEAPRDDWDRSQALWERRHRDESVAGWSPLRMTSARVVRGGSLRQRDDGSIAFESGGAEAGTVFELSFQTDAARLNGLRLDTLPDPALPGQGAGLGKDGEFVLSQVEAEVRSRDSALEDFARDPLELGPWSSVGPFAAGSEKEAFDKEFGPEKNMDPSVAYADGKLRWTEHLDWKDGEYTRLESQPHGAVYLMRTLTVSEPRVMEAALGSDDGLRVWLNGRSLLAHQVARALGPDQERVRLWLRPGENRLLLKISNAGGESGFHFRVLPGAVTSAPLDFAAAGSDHQAGEHVARAAIDGRPETGWSVGAGEKAGHSLLLRSVEDFGFKGGSEIVVRLRFESPKPEALLARFRVSAAWSPTLPEFLDYPAEVQSALFSDAAATKEDARLTLRKFFRSRAVTEANQTRQLLAAKRKERDDFRNGWPTAMVMRQASPMRETQVRIRGQYFNKGEKVEPGVPVQLYPWKEGLPPNRLGLARWLVDPGHPLTPRVAVNQYWQRLFGVGLVKTAEDFGSQGEWPSHPELLDWLATEFIRCGWDIKAMQRLLVTSATYRQDSAVTRELLDKDPENRWLARGPRFRLDAENVRDVALAAAGLLNPKVGGPSAFPFQPPGLWGQVSFEGTRDYVQSDGAENYRRGLYTYWRRSIPYASFTVFDAPSREVCIVRRPRTNTPLQALALLNDPVYVEAARALAQRVLQKGGTTVADRLDYAFRVTLGRKPSEKERGILKAACEREFRRFAENREAANQLLHVGASRPPVQVDIAELAAWTMLANTLLNLDETITRG